jgi:hypothetical protein
VQRPLQVQIALGLYLAHWRGACYRQQQQQHL